MVVPFEKLLLWPVQFNAWNLQSRPVKWVITPAIFVFLAKSWTHLEVQLGRDCDVSRIKEPVQVGPEQNSVANLMGSVVSV